VLAQKERERKKKEGENITKFYQYHLTHVASEGVTLPGDLYGLCWPWWWFFKI
jgi:hypothetical protein